MAKPGDCPDEPAWLDSDEQSRHDRFTIAAARRRFLLSHCFLRSVLSKSVPSIDPDVWRYEVGSHGRPELTTQLQVSAGATTKGPLRFNLSHTENLFAVVVTRDLDCGVDVETVTRSTDLAGVGRRSFSDDEFAHFQNGSDTAQRQRFFEFWTLKESYIKAIGTGMYTPLKHFGFDLAVSPPTISFSPELQDDAEHWQFGLSRPTESEQLAWALERRAGLPPPSVNIAWFA